MNGRLFFKWTNDALIVANTGRYFSRGGLEAVCASHLSDKSNGPQRFDSETDAREAVDMIHKRELQVYLDSKSRVIQDARLETEMGRDYTNRLLLELMQNADDAAAEKPIGYKGLGFKSVLDICKSAYIYSGCLCFKFDQLKTCQALQEVGILDLNEVPVLRLPFWNDAEEDPTIKHLRIFYDTVITLP